MEKLELKHLAPYLPYGLKGIDIPEGYTGIREMNLFNIDWFLENTKIILRPLSDLTREINIKGNKFIPIEYFEIGDDDFGTEFDHGNIKTIKSLTDISVNNSWHDLHYMPYILIQQLLEWHFDIFGLIDKGLAISYSDAQSTSIEG